MIDVSNDGSINGIEILEASITLSKLLNTKITASDIKHAKDVIIISSTGENALYTYLHIESKKVIRFPIVMPAIRA